MSQTWIQTTGQITDPLSPLQGLEVLIRCPMHARHGGYGIPTVDVRVDDRWVPLQLALAEMGGE